MRGVAIAIALGLFAPLSVAATSARAPTERSCIVAWNAPQNRSNREAVAAAGSWTSALVVRAIQSGVRWDANSSKQSPPKASCWITLVDRTSGMTAMGAWAGGRVLGWRLTGPSPDSDNPIFPSARRFPNARVLSNGALLAISS